MTKFILLRHGATDYRGIDNYNFAHLSEKGILEIEKAAQNSVFGDSDILISSPLTRAIESAYIISNKYGLDVKIYDDLREWEPTYKKCIISKQEFINNYRIARNQWQEVLDNKEVIYNLNFESFESVKERALNTLNNFLNYDKVIVVSHGLLINILCQVKVKLHTGKFVMVTINEIDENNKKQYVL